MRSLGHEGRSFMNAVGTAVNKAPGAATSLFTPLEYAAMNQNVAPNQTPNRPAP